MASLPAPSHMRVLIVVKTYPNPSQRYGETVCCAGIDMATRQWVRIYPVNFRRLAARRFQKYQVIECVGGVNPKDQRPESRRVDQDTIEVTGPVLSTKDGWRERLRWLPPLYRSLEEVDEAHRAEGITLAAVRPKKILGLKIEPAPPWSAKKLAMVRQQRLGLGEDDSKQLQELEQIPFRFKYRFRCDDPRCNGHTKLILDWEVGESYRKWRREYGRAWQDKFRDKYERWLPCRDLQFVMGTMKAHPDTFTIVGLIYPPWSQVQRAGSRQLSLELLNEQ
jgi:hypothetical protein